MKRVAGFTLIELMIVITLISIIATIAIPNLLRARMTANEVSAIAGLKAIAENQEIFRRQDVQFDIAGISDKRGQNEYAPRYYFMYEADKLIEPNLARANIAYTGSLGDPAPFQGYFYNDVIALSDGTTSENLDNTVRYAIFAAPAQYNLTGVNCYYMDNRGVVFQKNTGTNDMTPSMHPNPEKFGYIVTE